MYAYEEDLIIEKLRHKVCPLHNCPMNNLLPLVLGKDYVRDRYKCPICDCRVDFVGAEIKTDSIGKTLAYVRAYRSVSRQQSNVVEYLTK